MDNTESKILIDEEFVEALKAELPERNPDLSDIEANNILRYVLRHIDAKRVEVMKALTSGKVLEEVGEKFGITKERVRQLKVETLFTIQRCLLASDLHDFRTGILHGERPNLPEHTLLRYRLIRDGLKLSDEQKRAILEKKRMKVSAIAKEVSCTRSAVRFVLQTSKSLPKSKKHLLLTDAELRELHAEFKGNATDAAESMNFNPTSLVSRWLEVGLTNIKHKTGPKLIDTIDWERLHTQFKGNASHAAKLALCSRTTVIKKWRSLKLPIRKQGREKLIDL